MKVLFKKEYAAIIGIVIVSFFLFFWGLGSNHLSHWDEAWYADMSRTMARTGNIITPIWNRAPFFDKPPLYMWLTAGMFSIFGISDFSARFFSALSGVATVIVLYFLGKEVKNKTVGVLASVILLSTTGFLYRSRTGNLDTLFAFWILLTILSFYSYITTKKIYWVIVFSLSVASGFLTKGFLVFAFPAIALFYGFLFKDKKILQSKILLGLGAGVLISLIWFLVSFSVNGRPFVSDFFLNQIGKITRHGQPWRYFSLDYVGYLKSDLKIWFLLFPLSTLFSIYDFRRTRFMLTWVYLLFFLLLLSFSENKSNWFLVPFYPVIALLTAYATYGFVRRFLGNAFIPLLVVSVIIVGIAQGIRYRKEFIVGDTAGDDARIALAAKNITTEYDNIYLTNYYYPTIVYYSQRRVYALYSDHEKNEAWWIRPKEDWKSILKRDRVFIITTKNEMREFKDYFSPYNLHKLGQSGDKVLLRKEPI